MNGMFKVMVVISLAGLSVVLCTGCGKKAAEKVAEKTIEEAIKAGDGDLDVDVNVKDGVVSITTRDAEGKVGLAISEGKMTVTQEKTEENVVVEGDDESFTMTMGDGDITAVTGKKAKVPDDFPKDVPVYPGSEVLMSMKMSEKQIFTLQLGCADALDTVGAYYKKESAAKGWTESQSMAQGGESPMQMLMFTKEGRMITVTIAREEGKTMINLQTGTN